MTKTIVADVTWRFNKDTKQVEIIKDGMVVETTTLVLAPSRVTWHRNEAAQGQTFVEASAYRKHNRRAA